MAGACGQNPAQGPFGFRNPESAAAPAFQDLRPIMVVLVSIEN